MRGNALEGETPESYRAPWLNLLHYESLTPEDFVRKWAVHVEAGMETKFRADEDWYAALFPAS